jgi:hypothetical protein
MLLNGGILLLSFHFFRKVSQRGGLDERASMPIVASIGLLLVTNDVAKAFVWSPHTQMRRKGGSYPLSHLYGHFGLVRLCRLGHDVPWVKA